VVLQIFIIYLMIDDSADASLLLKDACREMLRFVAWVDNGTGRRVFLVAANLIDRLQLLQCLIGFNAFDFPGGKALNIGGGRGQGGNVFLRHSM